MVEINMSFRFLCITFKFDILLLLLSKVSLRVISGDIIARSWYLKLKEGWKWILLCWIMHTILECSRFCEICVIELEYIYGKLIYSILMYKYENRYIPFWCAKWHSNWIFSLIHNALIALNSITSTSLQVVDMISLIALKSRTCLWSSKNSICRQLIDILSKEKNFLWSSKIFWYYSEQLRATTFDCSMFPEIPVASSHLNAKRNIFYCDSLKKKIKIKKKSFHQ